MNYSKMMECNNEYSFHSLDNTEYVYSENMMDEYIQGEHKNYQKVLLVRNKFHRDEQLLVVDEELDYNEDRLERLDLDYNEEYRRHDVVEVDLRHVVRLDVDYSANLFVQMYSN